ncbi:MAG: galactose mutarotase [Termitinemataceae bacterium]|nr:MAG: galactose mutarotase [Termitinemataceae bacterium]
MQIDKKLFGTLACGTNVFEFQLTAGEIKLCILELGAAWRALFVKDKNNHVDDLLLGFDSVQEYAKPGGPFFGGTIGRYANRIAGSSFIIDDVRYSITCNEDRNCLHGGILGFDKRLWKGSGYKKDDGVFVRFEYTSSDNEEGFPGIANAVVTYGVNKKNQITACYHVRVNKKCPVNITNHAYYNLNAHNNGSILDHKLKLNSSYYLPVNDRQIPSGEIKSAAGTCFDFLQTRPIQNEYDHCFVVEGVAGTLRDCAVIYAPQNGRFLKVATTAPGVQFYTGNSLDKVCGKGGAVYERNAGFCIETQNFPDAPNQAHFPSAIYSPDKDYHEETVFEFSVV